MQRAGDPITGPSRIPGPRKLLQQLRRIRARAVRTTKRPLPPDEQRWLASVADAIDRLEVAGEAVLSGGANPRDWRRVSKTTRELF